MSLKDIKTRITSVANTRKTTSAMKMVSSVKLRKAQQSIHFALPYVEQLNDILLHLTAMPRARKMSPFVVEREVKKVAVVCFSSDSSLCGAFNSNIIKHCRELIGDVTRIDANPYIYTVGQKITEAFVREEIQIDRQYAGMMAKRSYDEAAMLADKLMDMYLNGHLDRAILSYTHFISLGSQQIINETLLPVTIPSGKDEQETEYILEPSAEELMKTLLPKVIRMKVYCAVLDSYTSEQAARMIAMQAATDNADNLIDELTLQFNKLRQQAITNEILDLAGGSRN
ncbi:MAG: ATP synthase F1 subunit gamma [Bacteroidaceae bacterium]|jgi:F-type H+-transporting ATPase subunit gamma|nr:MAG: ATP synthase gamma chain [Bacteroidetes bacterium ADurb.BinA104]HBA13390.1 ATP synthase F1 subunit gamma [Bacteroidales bacterium]HOD68762.1 ATP synthase F1 subunit gamma [Bacteroidaceae bacterium]HQL26250.1 ATP synthase F1 subunit gamma [Bacteroidaceae bacterium]